ncbi:MAG: imidazolonepropionase-like amidohydrolase [Planctomycetota bacterium]|jgi:imidazolonepropionase-like amidohydrolase
MKHILLGLLLLSVSIFSSAEQMDLPTTPTLAIIGGQLIDGYGGRPLRDAAVIIADNRIIEVGRASEVSIPEGIKIVDVNGMSIMPGLWESHGHLFHAGEGDPNLFPSRFSDQADSIMASVAKTSLLSGITSFRDTGGPIEKQLVLRADIEAGKLPGPRLYFAGPILRQRSPEATARKSEYTVASPKEAKQVTEKVIALGVDQIKVYGFWDLDILRAICETAHKAGLGVDADVRHVTAYRTAIEAGVDRLHHVFTADSLSGYSDEDMQLLVRGLKPAASGPMANILRGPFILPTIEMRNAYVRAFKYRESLDHPRLKQQYSKEVYESLRASWTHPEAVPWGQGAPERIKAAKRKLKQFIEAGGREQLVAGTDAGAPFNLHSPLTKEIGNLFEAGLSAMEAIQSATLRPAQMQGVEKDLGTVSKGKLADMIIIDGDPLQDITLLQHKVVLIIKDGKVYKPENYLNF